MMGTVKQLGLIRHCIVLCGLSGSQIGAVVIITASVSKQDFLFVKWSYSTIEKSVLEMLWFLSYFAQNTASKVSQII